MLRIILSPPIVGIFLVASLFYMGATSEAVQGFGKNDRLTQFIELNKKDGAL